MSICRRRRRRCVGKPKSRDDKFIIWQGVSAILPCRVEKFTKYITSSQITDLTVAGFLNKYVYFFYPIYNIWTNKIPRTLFPTSKRPTLTMPYFSSFPSNEKSHQSPYLPSLSTKSFQSLGSFSSFSSSSSMRMHVRFLPSH